LRAHHAAHPLWLRTRSAARRSRRLTSPRAVAGGAENRVRACVANLLIARVNK